MRNPNRFRVIKKHSITMAAMLALLLGGIFRPAPAPVSAQQGQPADVPVHMVVTVKPHHGTQVPALAPDDVKVYQKGHLDTVASWVPLQGDRAGLQLYILIDDTSRSTLALQYKSIGKFIDEQPSTTAIAVGYMRNGTVFTAQNLTTDHTLAEKSLRLPLGSGTGYTSPYLALSELMKKWPDTKDRREILMISSGIDPLGGGFSNDPFTNPYLDTAFEQAGPSTVIGAPNQADPTGGGHAVYLSAYRTAADGSFEFLLHFAEALLRSEIRHPAAPFARFPFRD